MSAFEDSLIALIDERIQLHAQTREAYAREYRSPDSSVVAPPGSSSYGPVTMPPGPPVATPQAPPPGPPVATPQAPPPGPPVAGLPPATVAPPPPASAPVAGVPTLDEIRALGNDFARGQPQRAAEFVAFMATKGVSSLADMPPTEYLATKAELQRLMGVG